MYVFKIQVWIYTLILKPIRIGLEAFRQTFPKTEEYSIFQYFYDWFLMPDPVEGVYFWMDKDYSISYKYWKFFKLDKQENWFQHFFYPKPYAVYFDVIEKHVYLRHNFQGRSYQRILPQGPWARGEMNFIDVLGSNFASSWSYWFIGMLAIFTFFIIYWPWEYSENGELDVEVANYKDYLIFLLTFFNIVLHGKYCFWGGPLPLSHLEPLLHNKHWYAMYRDFKVMGFKINFSSYSIFRVLKNIPKVIFCFEKPFKMAMWISLIFILVIGIFL